MTYDHPTAFWSWGDEEHEAMARVMASGQFTAAHEVKAFEAEFAAFHGRKHAIMVNSGSSANLVAVAALFHKRKNPLKAGDRAIVPAIAWNTTYAPLIQLGLDLVVADVDDTWNARPFNWESMEGLRLVMGVPILGNPAYSKDWRRVLAYDAYYIEDACESLGAKDTHGKFCGAFGDMATYSFFISHQMAAIEGGMVLTDDEELATLCRMLRAHGWTRDIRKPERFEDEYDFVLPGYNVRPMELHAAIAREQLKKLPAFTQARRLNYAHFAELVEGLPIIMARPNGQMNPFGLHFEMRHAWQRPMVVQALRANGIDCRLPTGGSFTKHPYGARWANQATPRADQIHERGLFIGNAPWPILEKIEKAVQVIKDAL